MLEVDAEVDRRGFTVRAALRVAAGERLALFGPSGAGKTTVLETIAGLVAPRRALITLGGRLLTSTEPPVTSLPCWRRRVGLLRQEPALFPHLSVRDNLRYAQPAARSAAELAELARALGIGELLTVMPARLSGGQAHRVALGRLLLAGCDALLLDEPYTGLDASLQRQMTELVAGFAAERALPAVLVAHELVEAQAFADRLAVLEGGEILQAGPPDEVVLRPASLRVAALVGYRGFVPIRPPGSGGQGSRADPATAGGGPGPAPAVVAGIHPDRVLAGAHPSRGLVVSGTVTQVRPAGAGWDVTLAAGEDGVSARLPDKPRAGAGLVITALDPPCFGPDGAALPGQLYRAEQVQA